MHRIIALVVQYDDENYSVIRVVARDRSPERSCREAARILLRELGAGRRVTQAEFVYDFRSA